MNLWSQEISGPKGSHGIFGPKASLVPNLWDLWSQRHPWPQSTVQYIALYIQSDEMDRDNLCKNAKKAQIQVIWHWLGGVRARQRLYNNGSFKGKLSYTFAVKMNTPSHFVSYRLNFQVTLWRFT